jgi:hypothetical protein
MGALKNIRQMMDDYFFHQREAFKLLREHKMPAANRQLLISIFLLLGSSIAIALSTRIPELEEWGFYSVLVFIVSVPFFLASFWNAIN